MNHPPYEVNSHAEAQAWRAWSEQASVEELLEALHGCASFLSVPATECCAALQHTHKYVLVGNHPSNITLEKAEA